MKDEIIKMLDLPKHPFFVGPVSDDHSRKDLPKDLPFHMGIHPRYVIPRLILTDDISDALQKAYAIGSMASTPLGESELATVRMKEVMEKLLELFGGSIKGKNILEIGSGNGELLYQLQKKGAIVTGLEIGPQAAVAEERYGISVIKEPLVKDKLNAKFDCIFSYGCLEHIENIDEFFEASRSYLVNKGLFFHSVPNSELSFKMFHIDHLLHEHINYFTPKNGVALLEAQKFVSASSCLTKNGNELMLWGYYDETADLKWPLENLEAEKVGLENYSKNLGTKFSSILNALKKSIQEGNTIGLYAGGFEYGFHLQEDSFIRYFDGDEFKHGKRWLVNLPDIESPQNLVDKKVDKLIICKPHYFEAISNILVDMGFERDRIVNIESLSK